MRACAVHAGSTSCGDQWVDGSWQGTVLRLWCETLCCCVISSQLLNMLPRQMLTVLSSLQSTLSRHLSKMLDVPYFPEPVEGNPYLADFYKDPSTWAPRMEVVSLCSFFLHVDQRRSVRLYADMDKMTLCSCHLLF